MDKKVKRSKHWQDPVIRNDPYSLSTPKQEEFFQLLEDEIAMTEKQQADDRQGLRDDFGVVFPGDPPKTKTSLGKVAVAVGAAVVLTAAVAHATKGNKDKTKEDKASKDEEEYYG